LRDPGKNDEGKRVEGENQRKVCLARGHWVLIAKHDQSKKGRKDELETAEELSQGLGKALNWTVCFEHVKNRRLGVGEKKNDLRKQTRDRDEDPYVKKKKKRRSPCSTTGNRGFKKISSTG